jgi:hypothetical protein
MQKVGCRATLWLAAMLCTHMACAVPLTVTNTYQFLDNVSPNSVGITSGLRQQLGANCVVPVGTPCTPQAAGAPFGTTGSASQAGVTLPLNFVAADLTSNHFSVSRAAGILPTGPWALTFINGADTAPPVNTPSLVAASPIGFVGNVLQTAGNSPTFSWTLPPAPPGQAIDAVAVQIRDTTTFLGTNGVGGGGNAVIIFRAALPPSTTSLTIAPGDSRFLGGNTALLPGRTYSLEIQVQDTRNNLSGGGFPNVVTQSRSIPDFQLLPAGSPATYIPTVDTSGPVPVHRFLPISVRAAELIFIDPLVAVGFDYQTSPGNPNFRSVLLPTGFGDNLFDLSLWSGIDWVDTGLDLAGGVEFLFTTLVGAGGVDRFRITGIEPSELVDPFAATAFTTGVSFVADGIFSGTMTPLIAQVPEPQTLSLLLATLGLFGWVGTRRRPRALH